MQQILIINRLYSVICRLSTVLGTSTIVENPLQIAPFYAKQSQFAPSKMGANSFVAERYENKSRRGLRENKAKQSQFHAPAPTTGVGKGEKSLAVAKSLTG